MKIEKLHIENFKSFKSLNFAPSDLTVILGPNGAGKSNFAMALDFLADTYGEGIEYAIAKKGGYENIAHRKIRRTKAPLVFRVEVKLDESESFRVLRSFVSNTLRNKKGATVLLTHQFSICASTEAIRTDFKVTEELLSVSLHQGGGDKTPLYSVRQTNGEIIVDNVYDNEIKTDIDEYIKYYKRRKGVDDFTAGDLLIRDLLPIAGRYLARMTVYQFSPQICRNSGAPSPEPKLSAYGQNLPSLVDWLARRFPKKWKEVTSAMKEIIPSIDEISTEYLHTKTLGLFFKEDGIGRKWTAEDVSDGTIQSLAVLSVIADPRNSLIIIEELENSVHPWIVKVILAKLRKLSASKQAILTTHSPVLINLVDPAEVWVCYKQGNESHLDRLSDLYPDLVADWKEGKLRLFDYLDMGLAPQAMPSA